MGRNDPCPCNSGLKTKKCYEQESANCTLFQKHRKEGLAKEHGLKEKRVINFLTGCSGDLQLLFILNKESNKGSPIRMLLIGCFTLIDVLASYWFKYLGKNTDWHKTKFIEFVNQFCLTENNPEYSNSEFRKITAEELYTLRCSAVHFYGLGNGRLVIEPILYTDEDKEIAETKLRKLKNIIKKEKNENIISINPEKLRQIVMNGAIMLIEKLKENVKNSKNNSNTYWSHIEGINRIFEKYNAEGAINIPISKTK